jgi:hypothetical protein
MFGKHPLSSTALSVRGFIQSANDISEAGASTDSQFNIFTTNQFLTETATASESEFNLLSADVTSFERTNKNLLVNTETFSDRSGVVNATAWYTQTAVTLTNNLTVLSPDNTTYGVKYNISGVSGRGVDQRIRFPIIGQQYTYSIWVKAIVDTTILFGNYDITTAPINASSVVVTAAAGWTRLSHTFTATSATYYVQFGDISGGTGDRFYVWGNQLELGSSATTYSYTEYTESQSKVITAVRDITEMSGTNLLAPRQTTFNDAWWTKSAVTVTLNATTAPDGSTTATKLIQNTTNSRHAVQGNFLLTITPNTTYTVSVYAKAAENNFVSLIFGKSGVPYTRAGSIVDLTTGTITNYASSAVASVTRNPAVSVGSGWWRISVTVNIDTTSADGYVEIGTLENSTQGTGYAGSNNTNGIYIWGPQLEVGTTATTYSITPVETSTNVISTNQLLTETGNASETEDRLLTILRDITETTLLLDQQFNIATRIADITESGTAVNTENRTVLALRDITETSAANDSQNRIITALRDIIEAAGANDSQNRVITAFRSLTETGTSSDSQFNTALRIADLIESITATELNSTQAAFVSAIQEALTAIDAGIGNKITTSSVAEIVSALESQNRFAFYAGNISELLNAIVEANTNNIPAFITETGSLSTIELANLLVNRGVLETVNASDADIGNVISNSYITEISVAGETVVVWVFFPMDYELVSSRYSSLVEIEADQIYADNIDVFYVDAAHMFADISLDYDQIYVDNIDVLYGNIALIDDVLSDEINI